MANDKSSRVISVETNLSSQTLVISVSGKTPLTFHAERLSVPCRTAALMLGAKNRIVDTAAKSRDPATGLPASVDEKYESMKRIIEHLESGSMEWAVRSAPRSASDENLLIAALMEVLGQKDRAKVASVVKSWDRAKRDAVRMRDDVKTVVDRITSENAADVDTDDLLAEII